MGAPHRVLVTALGETPLEAVERHTSLLSMEVPGPSALAEGDVLVEIKSASVGWVDLVDDQRAIPAPAQAPVLSRFGVLGVVASVGKAVTRVGPGDAVLVDGFLAGPRSSGAHQAYGGFASFSVAPAEAVIKIPGRLTFDQACNLLGNYETAYHCLITRGHLQPGETVLIHGASGSTGLAAVQVAKLVGAQVIATGRSDAKLAAVRQQGADHTINCTPAEGASGVRSFRDEVKALTGGRGVAMVYDGVGGEISLESLRCVRFGARYLIVGWAATPFVAKGKGERGAPNANALPTNLVMMKGLDVLGCPTVISTVNDPALRPPRLAQVLRWAEEGRINPQVSHVFPLTDFKQAMRAKWNGEVVGGCVLHP